MALYQATLSQDMALSPGRQCCLFFTNLPDGCIFTILQFYSKELTVKCLAQFSSMTSGLYRAIQSNTVRLVWPSLPPLCLCSTAQCRQTCGREKVPQSYFKSVLSRCNSQSRKGNIHFHATQPSEGPKPTSIANEAHSLVKGCAETLEDLALHITISSEKGFIVQDSYRPVLESGEEEHDRLLSDNHSCCIPSDAVSSRVFAKDSVTYPHLKALIINIEFDYRDGEILLLTEAICIALLTRFGNNLRGLSIFTYHLDEQEDKRCVFDPMTLRQSNEIRTNCLDLLCPVLKKLELFGCNLMMFVDHSSSKIVHQIQLNQKGTIAPPRKADPASFIEYSPLQASFLTVLELEKNFKEPSEIFDIFRIIPSAVTHLILMGNTSKFLREILDFIHIEELSNMQNVEVLEIHDVSPWPFCDEKVYIDASTITNVFGIRQKLKRIVMSTVHFTDSDLLNLFSKQLLVTDRGSTFSTEVIKKTHKEQL